MIDCVQGDRGDAGSNGAKGDNGNKGDRGSRGFNGQDGQPGAFVSISKACSTYLEIGTCIIMYVCRIINRYT